MAVWAVCRVRARTRWQKEQTNSNSLGVWPCQCERHRPGLALSLWRTPAADSVNSGYSLYSMVSWQPA